MEWQAFLNTVVMPKKFETVLLGWGLSLTPDPYMIWHSKGMFLADLIRLATTPVLPIDSLNEWKIQRSPKRSQSYSAVFLRKSFPIILPLFGNSQ